MIFFPPPLFSFFFLDNSFKRKELNPAGVLCLVLIPGSWCCSTGGWSDLGWEGIEELLEQQLEFFSSFSVVVVVLVVQGRKPWVYVCRGTKNNDGI